MREQKPAGDYADTVVREAGWPEIYFAFANEADAQKFAACLEADPIESHPGWASRRAFEIDLVKVRQLGASLPPASRPPSLPPSYEARPPRRTRRGPRAPVRRYDEE